MYNIFPEPVDALGFARIGRDMPYEVIHHDNLQSVLGLSGHDGTVLQTISYDPFGNTISTTGSSNNNQLHYTGREQDPDTGLYNYRARIYDPTTGRFLTEDAKSFTAGVNFFAYCKGNPVNCNDPYGFGIEQLSDVKFYKGSDGQVHFYLENDSNGPMPQWVSTVLPPTIGLLTTLVTGSVRAGVLASDVTDSLIGLTSETPAGLPKVPISPVINPPGLNIDEPNPSGTSGLQTLLPGVSTINMPTYNYGQFNTGTGFDLSGLSSTNNTTNQAQSGTGAASNTNTGTPPISPAVTETSDGGGQPRSRRLPDLPEHAEYEHDAIGL